MTRDGNGKVLFGQLWKQSLTISNDSLNRRSNKASFRVMKQNDLNQSSDILQHSQNRQTGDRLIKIKKIPHWRFWKKLRQIQVVNENTLRINNTGYGWYIGS